MGTDGTTSSGKRGLGRGILPVTSEWNKDVARLLIDAAARGDLLPGASVPHPAATGRARLSLLSGVVSSLRPTLALV